MNSHKQYLTNQIQTGQNLNKSVMPITCFDSNKVLNMNTIIIQQRYLNLGKILHIIDYKSSVNYQFWHQQIHSYIQNDHLMDQMLSYMRSD